MFGNCAIAIAFAAIATTHHMIDGTWVLDSDLAGHNPEDYPTADSVSILRTDPCLTSMLVQIGDHLRKQYDVS
jgi:hypothetical protein